MNAQTKKAIAYLKEYYGIDPNDLGLSGKFDIEEVERLAIKFDLDRINVNAYGMPETKPPKIVRTRKVSSITAELRACVIDGKEVRQAYAKEKAEFYGVYLRGETIALHLIDFDSKKQAKELTDRINFVIPEL